MVLRGPSGRSAVDDLPEGTVYFKQIFNEDCGCSSYVIASRQSKEAAVVDSAIEIHQYLDLARDRSFKIKYVIDTHLHADHVSGNRKLVAATGAELCLHESADVLFPFRRLKDGEELHLGQLILKIVHTPGHRPESISIMVTNPPRGEQVSMVLSGDTLFVGDVGRPDFGGPDGARQQYESVHKLLQLDDFVEVFPAHFEGSCGKGMCGRPSSTIGFERRYNPLLQVGKDEFVRIASEVPARPLNMTAIIDTNRGVGSYEWAQPCGRETIVDVSVEVGPTWIEQHQPFVLDVREPEEYGIAHLPGAHSLPQADLANRLAEVPRERPVLVVCAGGNRSLRAAQFLKHIGYEQVANLVGGTGAWIEGGNPTESESLTGRAN